MLSVSPGNTGFSQRRLSMPGEPRLDDSSTYSSHIMRMAIAQVCQPLAASRPNSDCAAASSSRWKGCGSKSRAKASAASRVTGMAPKSRTEPTTKSSQWWRIGARALVSDMERSAA